MGVRSADCYLEMRPAKTEDKEAHAAKGKQSPPASGAARTLSSPLSITAGSAREAAAVVY